MLGAIRCDACRAKVRADRVRCLRCGAPLGRTAAAPPARRPSTPVIAAVAGVALVGVAAVLAGRAGGEAAVMGGTPVAASSGSAAGNAAANGSAPSAAQPLPAPIAVSMDASRGAVAAYNRGDVAGSVEQFSAAVAADPQNADALNNLGQVLVRSGRARDAIPYFDRAIALSDSVWAYHFNRARAYGEMKEWARAAAGYRDAARLFPDDYVTAFNHARALQANGDLGGAIAEFERAIALAPGEPEFHLAHAYALETAQRQQEAVAAYRRYLDLQISAPHAEKIMARIVEIEGGPPAAAPTR